LMEEKGREIDIFLNETWPVGKRAARLEGRHWMWALETIHEKGSGCTLEECNVDAGTPSTREKRPVQLGLRNQERHVDAKVKVSTSAWSVSIKDMDSWTKEDALLKIAVEEEYLGFNLAFIRLTVLVVWVQLSFRHRCTGVRQLPFHGSLLQWVNYMCTRNVYV
jgi:hypothetical protein